MCRWGDDFTEKPFLGSAIDSDDDGQPSDMAQGDDRQRYQRRGRCQRLERAGRRSGGDAGRLGSWVGPIECLD